MSHNKKEIEIPGESTEEAKELELDEQPKPTRKVSHPATPMSILDAITSNNTF
jgi:hypothetical protein